MILCIISCQSYAETPVWTDSKHQISIGHIKYVLDQLSDFDLNLACLSSTAKWIFLVWNCPELFLHQFFRYKYKTTLCNMEHSKPIYTHAI